ncbi:MAG: hypothetical protein R3Y64_10305 [Peptostreptococcaceae bacterium]
MSKRYRVNPQIALGFVAVLFFVGYIPALSYFDAKLSNDYVRPISSNIETEYNNIMRTFLNSKQIFIENSNIGIVEIDDITWYNLKVLFADFSEIRSDERFIPLYEGHNGRGIRFETNFDIFRVYTVNQEKFFKVPIAIQPLIQDLLDDFLYTSMDYVKQYRRWSSLSISNGSKTKRIAKYNHSKIAYQLNTKRRIGDIQPLKSKAKSEIDYSIEAKGDNGYYFKLETMGKDYIKISNEHNEVYYEVNHSVYNYLADLM